ncbi:MAG: nucleotide-binding protein [Thermoleophilia bacterium]
MSAGPPLSSHSPFVLAVASGKGGTGKTFVATNMSALASAQGARVVLVDCDVEAPNDHLFLPRIEESITPVKVLVADVDPALCAACGRCRDACAYGAVRVLGGYAIVFEELCHGCGLCSDVCDRGAIRDIQRRVGDIAVGSGSADHRLFLVTGTLDVGQVKSPAVIRAARAAAGAVAADLIVLDAPPGVACSAVAAVRGADALLLVAEPTPFGLHDLELSLRLGRELRLPMAVVVNRDTGAGDVIEEISRAWDVPIVARIPFDRRVAEVYARGDLVGDALPEVSRILAGLPEAVRATAAQQVAP